jgi:hypothetical protein
MSFVIANSRDVANGLQQGQFAIGERRRAARLDDRRVLFACQIDRLATFGVP